MATSMLLSLIPALYLLLGYLLARRGAAPEPMLPDLRSLRRRMRQALRLPNDQPGLTMLRRHAPQLTRSLLMLRRDLRSFRGIALHRRSIRRLLPLAQRMKAAVHDAPALTRLIRQSPDVPSQRDRHTLPLLLRALLADDLDETLDLLLADAANSARAPRLLRRLKRAREPQRLLSRHSLTYSSVTTLLRLLREHENHPAQDILEDYLRALGHTPADVTRRFAQEQARQADHITRTAAALQAADLLDWNALLESADPLHELLSADATYAAMDAPSRASYRRDAAWLSRICRVSEETVAQAALALAADASADSIESHVGWYLTESDGQAALRHALHVRRGTLALWIRKHRFALTRGVIWAVNTAASLVFLQAGYSLWLLPVFLPVLGCFTRALLRRLLPQKELPRLALPSLNEDMRTLIVLPAVLRDRHDAIRAVRQLLTLRRALAGTHVDCLLLGDWTPSMTLRSGEDADVIRAAMTAVEALDDPGDTRYYYLQRSSAWSSAERIHLPRGGRFGAIEGLCQLMCRGEFFDGFDAASFDPQELRQRYAWILTAGSATRFEPDLLLRLAGTLAHPLNVRRHTRRGPRGFSLLTARTHALPCDRPTFLQRLCSSADDRDTVMLIRPGDLLEDTEGRLDLSSCTCASALWKALAGHRKTSAAAAEPRITDVSALLLSAHDRCRDLWGILPWQLSHVRTPRGVERNPLPSRERLRLRAQLRDALLPLCQLILLLAATLHHDGRLMLLALSAGFLAQDPGRALAELLMLPMQAWSLLDASVRGLITLLLPGRNVRELPPECLSTIELWSQSALAALLLWLSVLGESWFLPGFSLAAAFVAFPFLHGRLDATTRPEDDLTGADLSFLQEITASSWRFFEQHVTEETHHLPPDFRQLQPAATLSEQTSPRSAALYALSCLSALEAELIDANTCAQRLRDLLDALHTLPRLHGLMYAAYALDSLHPEENALIPAADNGLLCAALLCCAQGIRAYLPDVEEGLRGLPARLDDFAASMRLSALYDSQTGLFFACLDPQKTEQDAPRLYLFADEGLLLSFTAVMRREVPAEHLLRLSRSRVRIRQHAPLLTRDGGAQSLLPTLLLPAPATSLMACMGRAAASMQRRAARDGLMGKGRSAFYAFDSRLRYMEADFGLPETALHAPSDQPVYAPWASALLLPFAPRQALDSLRRMKALGMLGRQGFLESIDFAPERLPEQSEYALVRQMTAAHQGIILCAAANLLTGGALVRHFTALPMADAAALLLRDDERPLMLPAPTLFPAPQAQREAPWSRSARMLCAPVDAHILGSGRAGIMVNSLGSSALRFGGRDVTSFSGQADALEGLQLYLIQEEQVIRVLDPGLPGETVFSEGAARFTRRCGRMQCAVTILCDPSADAILHMVEISSDHALDQTVELADCLIPAFDAPVERPSARTLMLMMDDEALLHSFHTDDPLLDISVQSDLRAFLGRAMLEAPESLLHPARQEERAFHGVCLSFRLRMTIPAHGSRRITFSTQRQRTGDPAYAPGDAASQLTIARLHARTLTDSLSISQEQAAALSMLLGAVLWQGQLHQGAVAPLHAHLHLPQPLLTVQLATEEGIPLLREAALLTTWMRLTGFEAHLCVDCPEELRAPVEDALPAGLSVQLTTRLTDAERESLTAASRLVLREGEGSAVEQVTRLFVSLPAQKIPQPAPDLLEDDDDLLFDSGVSGFDPQTGECVIRSAPQEQPPRPWQHRLTSSRFATAADDGRLGASSAAQPVTAWEEAYLSDLDQGTMCSLTPEPCGRALHWRIRVSPGALAWRTAFSDLDLTLTAACMPRHACGLRTLRIKNAARQERRLLVHISAAFALHEDREAIALTPIGASILAQHPAVHGSGFLALAEGECRAFACTSAGYRGAGASPAFLPSERGHIGVLAVPVTVSPGGSVSLTWLTGCAAQADDLDLILRRIRRSGASAVFRSVRQQWAQRTEAITFATPEDSLNLLLNHWLPAQFLPSQEPLTAPACCLLEPSPVRPMLLLWARDHAADDLLPCLTAAYVRTTGDEAALNDLVPHDADHPDDPRDTLYARCLQSLHAPAEGLEKTLLRILSIEAFLPWTDAPDAADLTQLLPALRARVTDIPIDARLSALAVLALGATPAATFALRESYLRLFDPALGILRADESPDAPQDTLAAVWMLSALARLGWAEYAWTLLRALNPIHHTDDPHRTEEYRGEPYRMPASVLGAPPHAGQAGDIPSAEAAGLLYAAAVEQLLGLRRRGSLVELHPLLPEEWDACSLTLRQGSTLWHVDFDSRGEETSFTLADDGQVHHVHAPLHARRETAVT